MISQQKCTNPQKGDIFFNRNISVFEIFNGLKWIEMVEVESKKTTPIHEIKKTFDNWKDKDYCWKKLRENSTNIQFVNHKILTTEMWMYVIKDNEENIQYLDHDDFPIVWNYYILNNI